MSSQAFEAQLLVPDNNASHLQLGDLIAAGDFTGTGLPDVAHRYLDAFCNKSYSNARRRWAGIALAGMMRASASVVQRLKKLSRGLSRIGAILLDPEENEERRIVAGLIIRQGLDAGIDFAHFWESDKVMHSAPNFPRDPSEKWMGRFQTYLDTLSNLALTNLDTEALILFPMSLSTDEGYQWTGNSAAAVIERDLLTIVTSDSTLTQNHFIDIPISHIKETSLQQTSPHESQEGQSGHKIYNLSMTLRSTSSTYRLNSSNRTASEFKVSFLKREDAREFEAGLQDARETLYRAKSATAKVAGSRASPNSPDGTHQLSVQHNDVTRSLKHQEHAPHKSGANSKGTLNEPTSSELSKKQQSSTQHATQEQNRGKLPRISKDTKQKAVRTEQLLLATSKVTKPRVARKANAVVASSGDEDKEEDESSQDGYDLRSEVAVGARGRSQTRRTTKMEEDGDFYPAASKAKHSCTKRKRGSSNGTEDGRSRKKIQTKPSSVPRTDAISTKAKKQKTEAQGHAQSRPNPCKPATQSGAQQSLQIGASARPSLIGGLLKSKSPGHASGPMFKRPGQPASTPGKPIVQPVRPSPRPQTPAEMRGDLADLPVYISSSTPRSQTIHDEDFGLHYTPANTEILSSNTKRVPDSPHADSTAISGHADSNDVRREKLIGDTETAKSDPFQQRRQSQKKTDLFRRLTGEKVVDERPDSVQDELFGVTAEMNDNDDDDNELKSDLANQSFLKRSLSLSKHHIDTRDQARMQGSPAHVRESKRPSTTAKESSHKAAAAAAHKPAQLLNSEALYNGSVSQKQLKPNATEPILSGTSKLAAGEAASGDGRTPEGVAKGLAKENDSIVSVPREAVEETLPEVLTSLANESGADGDTTLVGEEMDLPGLYGVKASSLRFRSSPPIPDSSSVRGASSDESEEEPEPSPPTSRADELEWEAALQPHQRALHDQLLRTSRRVTRHIVDNETAVTDITDVFVEDGERLLDLMLERQSDETTVAFQELARKRQGLLKELCEASRDLKAQRKQVKTAD